MFNNRRGDAKWGFIEINEVLIWFNVCSPPTYVLFFFFFFISFFFYFFLLSLDYSLNVMQVNAADGVDSKCTKTVIKASFGLTPFYRWFFFLFTQNEWITWFLSFRPMEKKCNHFYSVWCFLFWILYQKCTHAEYNREQSSSP